MKQTSLKNGRIKRTRRATIARHREMACKTYELKVDISHLPKEALQTLRRLFLEAKRFYNHLIAQGIWNADYEVKAILVRNKDKQLELRTLQYLSSQMRQGIIDRAKDNIVGLSAAKKGGRKVGALKFKGGINSIPLKQRGITYRLMGDRIGIQNRYLKGRNWPARPSNGGTEAILSISPPSNERPAGGSR